MCNRDAPPRVRLDVQRMNWLSLHDKLIAAARQHPPGEQVPYSFEKRIMARLTTPPQRDEWAAWCRALWCGAGACAAVALLASAWTLAPFSSDADAALGFAQELEQTILANAEDAESANENWW